MSRPLTVRRGMPRRRAVLLACVVVALCWQPACWAAHVITRIDIRPGHRETAVALFTSDKRPLEANSFSLDDPPRLVFDFAGAGLDPDIPIALPVVAPAVQQIRLGQFSAEPKIARLVVDLSEDSAAPVWEVTAGREPGETLIVLRHSGPAVLGPPTSQVVEGASVVRLAGVGHLRRTVAVLADPPRVYADLTDAVVEDGYKQELSQGAIREIRVGQQTADPRHPVARIVLELRQEQAHVVFADGADLVVAVGPEAWALPLPEYQPSNRLKGRRIVVDPGHGGDDIGAPAVFGRVPKGPFEKDIVLVIGRRLAELLEAEGAAVTMTRDRDVYIGLRERAAIANNIRAHALVSIHCDSSDSPNTLHGTSVYYDHRHSRRFAHVVQEELVEALKTADRGVRNANFAVIRHTRGRGILVEIAYINHKDDRARLVHPSFQERAARAIVRGLVRFLSD
ncbi:MAG: N-acetylmuramoyl-L-alanine amidase [Armatimonadota bacterium]|nr:MAG: N-acetylmuramoyl-L-alanine amidase [Armatimonadota bacterium]